MLSMWHILIKVGYSDLVLWEPISRTFVTVQGGLISLACVLSHTHTTKLENLTTVYASTA